MEVGITFAKLIIWSISTKYQCSVKFLNLSLSVHAPRNVHGMFFSYEYTGVRVIYV